MMKVPGSKGSLEGARADGANIQVVYSPLDALSIAKRGKGNVVFFGIGFETTSPSVASTIHRAKEERIENFFVYSCHKLIPPAMRALLNADEVKIDGFICPGHVSTIIGSAPYEFIPKEYGVPCVISGFEPLDVLHSIYMLCKQIREGRKCVEIQYRRCVRREGNKKAQGVLYQVFEEAESEWRGLGVIPGSGLKIKEEYSSFDAMSHFEIERVREEKKSNCLCGEILRGVVTPIDCPLFANVCTPEQPVGPCMVSTEGTCSAYYKYERWRKGK
jgi:hydrogenase expression/formation protein HypD